MDAIARSILGSRTAVVMTQLDDLFGDGWHDMGLRIFTNRDTVFAKALAAQDAMHYVSGMLDAYYADLDDGSDPPMPYVGLPCGHWEKDLEHAEDAIAVRDEAELGAAIAWWHSGFTLASILELGRAGKHPGIHWPNTVLSNTIPNIEARLAALAERLDATCGNISLARIAEDGW